MAKNIGPVKFIGKIGDLSGRETKYGNIISLPGGFKGDRIKTEQRYEATRQLGSEFGRCSKIASQIYTCLQEYLKTIRHPHMYGFIQSLITNIKGCDTTSPKGERSFGMGLQTAEGRKMLEEFSFNPKKDLQSVMIQHFAYNLEQGVLTIENFDFSRVYLPKGTKKLGIQLVFMRLDVIAPLCSSTASSLLLISSKEGRKTFTLEARIPEGEGILIALLYFGFSNSANDEAYFLKNERNVLQIIGLE